MIKNEKIFFVCWILIYPFREFYKLISRGKEVLQPFNLYHRLNYPKAWMWITVILIVLSYVIKGSFNRMLVFAFVLTWIWKEYQAGHWKHAYREQLKTFAQEEYDKLEEKKGVLKAEKDA